MEDFNICHCWCQEPAAVESEEPEAASGQSPEQTGEETQVTHSFTLSFSKGVGPMIFSIYILSRVKKLEHILPPRPNVLQSRIHVQEQRQNQQNEKEEHVKESTEKLQNKRGDKQTQSANKNQYIYICIKSFKKELKPETVSL